MIPSKASFYPSKASLFQRDDLDSSETSNGCVECSSTPTAPTCKDGEESFLRARTCHLCPEYYCASPDGDSSKGPNIGGIVGGVVGGVVLIVAAGLLYYFLVWKKKHPHLDEEDIVMSDLEQDEQKETFSSDATDGTGEKVVSSGTVERPARRNNHSNRRLSSYELFTRPQAIRGARRGGRRGGKRQVKSNNMVDSVYMDPNSSNRNSIATTISTTNASNILPIAYIPGVTVRPTKNNTKSIYSYETDSIFSDLNTIENALIIGDIMRANYNGLEPEGEKDNTMTAIKAQPRLINVDRIEEEEEDEIDDEVEEVQDDSSDDEINTYNSKNTSKNSINTATKHLNDSTLLNITGQIAEEESESDEDSDIGEIQRATSIRRNDNKVKEVSREIPLDFIDLGKPMHLEGANNSEGLFVLDVEIDHPRPQSQTTDGSGERSPFEDPE